MSGEIRVCRAEIWICQSGVQRRGPDWKCKSGNHEYIESVIDAKEVHASQE